MSSLKAPDSNGRKTLGGTDESRTVEGCLIGSQDSDGENGSCELSEVARVLELEEGDDEYVEPDENESINSVILDKSKSCGGKGAVSKWGKAVKVDRPSGIGNCNEEPRSSNDPKSTNKLDLIFASCPKSGGSRSCDWRSEVGT